MSIASRSTTPSLPPSVNSYDASVVHHYRDRNTPSPETTIAGPSSRDQPETPRPYTPTAATSIHSSASRPKYGRSISSSRSLPRSQRAEVLNFIRAEEVRQLTHLEDVNEDLAERLEHETRRAELAENRAERAEARVREAQSKAQSYATDRQQAEVEITRLQEDVRRYQLQIEMKNRELFSAQAELEEAEQLRVAAEKNAVSARDSARQYRVALEAQQAREAGLLEGRRIGLQESMRGLLESAARAPTPPPASPRVTAESVRAAFQRGRARGYDEGRRDGIQTERRKAIEGFQRWLAAHEDEMPHLMQEPKAPMTP